MMARSAVFFSLALSSLALVRADDMPPAPVPASVPAADPDLPQPFDPAAFLPMLRNSPFNRVVDYTDTLQLTGVAWVDGRPMATFLEKATKRQIIVSDEANEHGWRLAEVNQGDGLRDAEIKLQVGDETFPFHYSEDQINPITKQRTGTSAAASSANKAVNVSSKSAATGTPHVSTSAYLNDADRDYYKRGMSKDVRDKFKDTMRNSEDKMAKMTDAQRASFSQKVFAKYKAMDTGAPRPTKATNASPKKARR